MERLTERDAFGGGIPIGYFKDDCCDCQEYCQKQASCYECNISACFEKLADYEDAEEQERLIKLPFTFGDIIFEISESRPEIYEWTIKGFQIFEDATYICVNDYTWINVTKLGKTIFRTLDEARAKLKEMEDGNAENHETE